MTDGVKRLLRESAERYETADFVKNDPSQFMHEVKSGRNNANREATAFLASVFSFGSIKQFVPKVRQLVDMAHGDVDAWIRSGAYRGDIRSGDARYYRFITYSNLRSFLDAYSRLIARHGTLGKYVEKCGDGTGLGAVKAICAAFAGAGVGYLVPCDATSACKRICMFLRWMVRVDSPVDFGIWSGFIDRRTLIVPLDTHVLAEAMRLGLVSSRQASMSAARKLTAALAEVFPDDPLKGDFALFGSGKNGSA